YLFSLWWVTPAIARQLEPMFPAASGPRLFLRHCLTFSLPTAAICVATWWALARLNLVFPPRRWLGFGPQPGRAVCIGLIAGVLLSAAVTVFAVILGERLHFHP